VNARVVGPSNPRASFTSLSPKSRPKASTSFALPTAAASSRIVLLRPDKRHTTTIAAAQTHYNTHAQSYQGQRQLHMQFATARQDGYLCRSLNHEHRRHRYERPPYHRHWRLGDNASPQHRATSHARQSALQCDGHWQTPHLAHGEPGSDVLASRTSLPSLSWLAPQAQTLRPTLTSDI
jgi:hypothetical protein